MSSFKGIVVIFIIGLSIGSCAVTKTNTTKSMDIYGPGVIQNPVIVDLEVNENKVTGTAIAKSSVSLSTVKQAAVTDALKKSNADVLVEPSFETITEKRRTTATVTGYPANYKNFRSVEEKDLPLLESGILQKADVHEPVLSKAKAKKGLLIGGVGAGILAIIGGFLIFF